jgi:hypothetical protein
VDHPEAFPQALRHPALRGGASQAPRPSGLSEVWHAPRRDRKDRGNQSEQRIHSLAAKALAERPAAPPVLAKRGKEIFTDAAKRLPTNGPRDLSDVVQHKAKVILS